MKPLRHAFIALLIAAALPVVATAAPDAESLARRGEIRAAVQAAEQRMREAPNDVGNQELYIDLLLSVGMASRAEDTFVAQLRAFPDRPDNHYLLGRALTDVRYAREAYENALRLDPDHARSHMGIGAVYTALGQPSDARAAYGRAVALDPTLSEAWLGLVRIELGQQRVEEAARAAVQGLAAVPHDPGLARAVATLVPARAGEVLAAGVRHTPDDAPLQTAWATWLLQEGEVERAAQAAATSLSIDPTDKEARRIAMLAADIGGGRLTLEQAVRAEAALGDGAALDALVAAAPSSVVVRLLRAATHREAGENDDALRHLQAALKVDPTHGEASAAAGQLLLQKGDAHAAVPLLEQAVQGAPHDEALRITWATALQQAGLRSKALGVMAQLAEERPLNVVVQGAYAQALVDAGQSEQAYVALRDALRVLPDPRLTAAFVMVAAESGHRQEAAALLDQLAKASGSEALAAKAEALRQP